MEKQIPRTALIGEIRARNGPRKILELHCTIDQNLGRVGPRGKSVPPAHLAGFEIASAGRALGRLHISRRSCIDALR